MSTKHRSRRKHSSYRGRRSMFPALLILAAVAILIFIIIGPKDNPTVDTPPQPGISAAPDVSASPAPSDEPSVPVFSGESSDPEPSQTPSEPPAPPSVDEAPWNLTLANAWHPLPEDWEIETQKLSNGLAVDTRIYDALTAMLNACKAEGLSPIVCSAYRTISKQQELFDRKINKYMADGLSYDEAYTAASSIVAIPGTSEHNLGLAVDICAASYQVLNSAQADTKEQQWLMEHCAEFGFILRYPRDKQDITGIIWEPWHYRYVGVELAQEITDSGLCLEEYLALHYSGV